VTTLGRLGTGRGAGWVWNPAGSDEQLALACKDLEAGRFAVASEALNACRSQFETRSRRSALLASVAARVDAVDHWVAEEPSNPDALLLAARTAVVHARRAMRRAAPMPTQEKTPSNCAVPRLPRIQRTPCRGSRN
jgi:hypothetical protein